MGNVLVGVVLPCTGRLRQLGEPLTFVLDIVRGQARRRGVSFIVADSRSTPEGARHAVRRLVRDERVSMVLTLGGTQVLPAVARACEELAVPCLSTTLPWQVFHRARRQPAHFAHHMCWGLDGIASAFAQLWEAAVGTALVGVVWNDGPQGTALRDPSHGFLPLVASRGHRVLDPGGYREGSVDFGPHVEAFRSAGVDVVTSAATAADLAAFAEAASSRGFRPRLITCSRWLAYPFGAKAAGVADIGTVVAWTPRHPYRASLSDHTGEELAADYQRGTGLPWSQPLGLAHALVEVAVHVLTVAHDPTDPDQVVQALRRTRLDTIVGPIDFPAGPIPTVATLPLAGGQWRERAGRTELVVVTNADVPAVPTADVVRPASWPSP
ncbi:ABC transporter substrate-binding protein [Solihabitans fulvus]|uniref:ABC transporter substrate-binding protein n=1 Tax=Solihabitans fulvus TaxID=1892852 RepID=A0A5B2WM03_9PSEU|nr:ABC transporter substrate-binding protein [Solihabitans fulvus]KAA2252465.1 ABC transporter substrate-binding protein [Solihabitans fulvus]